MIYHFQSCFFANTTDKLVFIVILEMIKYLNLIQVEQISTLETMLLDHDSLMEKMNNWNFQVFDLVKEMGDQSGRILSQVCCPLLYEGGYVKLSFIATMKKFCSQHLCECYLEKQKYDFSCTLCHCKP